MNRKILFAFLAICIVLSLTMIRSEETIPPGATPLLETPSQAELEILSNPTISQDQYLINPESYYYPSLNNPSSFMNWNDDYCNKTAGMDFIVEMAPDACQPSPVTSDLLEENDVPVMCKMTGIKINPLIDVPNIKNVRPIFKNQSKEIAYINFYPTRSALGSYQFTTQREIVTQGNPTLSNLGYIVVSLRQQPIESKMPSNVSVNVVLNITYDVSKTYGLHTEQFSLPVLTQDEWENGYKKYSFGNGKGYVRLQEVKDGSAKIAVYYSALGSPIASKEMREGDSLTFKLPGFYCQEGLNVTLDEIKVPTTRARLIVNGDEFLVEEGEDIADSGCQIQQITQEDYGYGGTVQITCQGAVYSGKGKGTYELNLAPKHANLNVQNNLPTKGSKSTKEVTLGSELELNVLYNNDYKLEYYYVAHIGKASAAGKRAQDVVILFASRTRTRLDDLTVKKYVKAFQKYLSSTNKPDIESDFTLKENVNKNPDVNGNIGYVKKIEKGTVRDLGGQYDNSANVEVLSVEGPKQVTYSAKVESAYTEAISQYRSISTNFVNKKDPAGIYYGIKALRGAQDLAHFMSKEDDEIDFLQEIIDQYQDNQDQDIQYEVESARDDISQISRGSGNKFTTINSQQGTYYVSLVSIESPGYNSQEATLKVNNTQGDYLIGSSVGDWAVSEINDNYVTFITSGEEETITKGSFKFLGPTKVQLIGTYIKKEAKVTFWPFEKERTTTTNFSVVIGISKRSIQLTPDQIQKKIRDLNKTIETLDKYVNALEKLTTAWKKACYVGGTVLWAKNLLEGFSGTPMARSIVMKAWTLKCASEEYRTQLGNNKMITVSQCYLKNKGSISTDVNSVKTIITEANDFVKTVKAKSGVVISSGLFGLSKQISDEKFLLEAKNLFLSDAKAKALIQDVTVSVPIGRLSRAQKDRILLMFKEGKITEEKARGDCSASKGVREMLGIPENNREEYTKEVKACIINVPVNVRYVIENFDKLTDQGLVSVDDIKELYLVLAINNKVNTDSKSISAVLRDYNNINVFSKFDNFESIILKKENRDTLSSKWGFDIQSSETENKKKPLTYNYIPTIDASVWGKFSSTDAPSLSSSEDIVKSYYGDAGGKPYMIFSDSGRTIFAILEPIGGGNYNYIKAFKILEDSTGKSVIQQQTNDKGEIIGAKEDGLSDTEKALLPRILEQDLGKCGHEMVREDYQIKFWESGPYEGLIAYMPILRNEGWYYATKSYSGFENKLVSYKETGQVNEYWICNVGENGKAEFNFYSGAEGDDCGCTEISKTTGMDVPNDKKPFVDKLEKSGGCIQKALQSRQKKESPINAGDCGKPIVGKPPVNIPSTQCEEFMSPEDCSLMFNLCDPVICPSSRCDFGGRFPVENVKQSGIVGSLVLCSSNTDVVVPICITGLYNGLDALNNMVFKQYRQCLQKQIDTGQTTGLCDYWHSVYFCQLLWSNLDPFIKAGIPLVTSSLNTGGGEYALFSDAFKSSQDSLTYFTQNYGSNAFTSFKEKSVDESSTSVCDRFLSIRYPTVAKFFDDLTKADSYYQLYASVDEVPMGGGSPESHYRVFYTIYAGRDQPLSYQVYLKKKINSQSYTYEQEKQYVRDATGFLAVGQTVSNKADIIAPSGYTEICISINGKDECGFGTLSTSFAVQELQNVYLQDQIKKNIKTQKECQAGSATIIPTASLNIQSQLKEALQPEIYRRGIVRICASDNPSGSTDSTRYQRIGYCDNEKIGCWLDMNSVNDSISDLGIVKDIYNYSRQSTITYMLEKEGYDLQTTSQDKLLAIEQEMKQIEKDANILIDTINQRFSEVFSNAKKNPYEEAGITLAPLTGMVTTNEQDMQTKVNDLTIPSNINKDEIQKILDDYAPDLADLNGKIEVLVKELRVVSGKCVSIEEKSRAEWDIAVLLDLKTKLKSQVEVALTTLAIMQGGSCAGNGGNWYGLPICPAGYKQINDATDSQYRAGYICCAQVLGKFEEFTQWYTDNLKIIDQNEKTYTLRLGDNEVFSPGKGRVIKADTSLKFLGMGNREFIVQFADNLFIKYTISGRAKINNVITKGKILTPRNTIFHIASTSAAAIGNTGSNIFTKTTPGGEVMVMAYVDSERDLRDPLCFFSTEKFDEIKKANPGMTFPSDDECKHERGGIEVEGVIYGTTPTIQYDALCQQRIVEIAKSGLGCDYVLGAPILDSAEIPNCITSPKTAFDCASFTQWVYNHYIDTYSSSISKIADRTATQQALKVGTLVSNALGKLAVYEQDKLQPGDLLFFKGAEPPDAVYDIGHAAIYIGNGQMIHAPTGSDGKGVRISDITNYYEGTFRGAKRVCVASSIVSIGLGQSLGIVRPSFYWTANGDLTKYKSKSSSDVIKLSDNSGTVLKTVGKAFIDEVKMEGSATFTSDSGAKIVFSYSSLKEVSGGYQITPLNVEYGTGARGVLIPYRSIAINPLNHLSGTDLAYGEVYYLSEMDGCPLPDGTNHDGLVIAQDTGSAFNGANKPADRVDLYIGIESLTNNLDNAFTRCHVTNLAPTEIKSVSVATKNAFYSQYSLKGSTPSGTQTPASSGEFSGVKLFSNKNNGDFDSSNANNLVSYSDSVKVCAVLEKDGKLYSSSEVSSKNSEVSAWSGTTPTINWYIVQPLWRHPDAVSASFATIYGKTFKWYENDVQEATWQTYNGVNADTIQYNQVNLQVGDWCLPESITQKVGTYYYRAEVTDTKGNVFSSAGNIASSSDIGAGKFYPPVFSGMASSLLEKSSYDHGIKDTLRISRKSNYANSQAGEKEASFIQTVEAYKNVPYILNTRSTLIEAYTQNFVAVECGSLLMGAANLADSANIPLSSTGQELVNKFGTLSSGSTKIEKILLSKIYSGQPAVRINKNEPAAMHIGDIIIMHDGTDYRTAAALIEDKDPIGYLSANDRVIYVSFMCQESNKGQLCYNGLRDSSGDIWTATILRII